MRYLAALVVGVCVPAVSMSASPISYSGVVVDNLGIPRDIVFAGDVDSGAIRGTATVDGNKMGIVGVLGEDGTISIGVSIAEGDPLGVVDIRPSVQDAATQSKELDVVYDLGGRRGNIRLPKAAIVGLDGQSR